MGDAAKKWADHAPKRDAKSLGKVAAWKVGDRKTGILMRRKCERAVQSMIAVASATKNKEMVAREDKLRAEGKLKSYDGPIKKARNAAKHALLRAQNAMHDANTILRMEMGKKNVVTSNRLQSDGARLVGENELHYRCRKTFHRANRVLKLGNAALDHARKNHYAHKEAVMKQTQKITMEKAAKLAHKERRAKSEARRKALGIKTKEEYAALLAKQALKYGELARDDAHKAAKAGKLAAAKALESANVKAELSGAKGKKTSTKTVTEALQRENIAADLAAKAAKMESAIVTGGHIPKAVMALVSDGHGKVKATALTAARTAAVEANVDLATSEDFHNFVNHKKSWKKHYKKIFHKKMANLKGN